MSLCVSLFVCAHAHLTYVGEVSSMSSHLFVLLTVFIFALYTVFLWRNRVYKLLATLCCLILVWYYLAGLEATQRKLIVKKAEARAVHSFLTGESLPGVLEQIIESHSKSSKFAGSKTDFWYDATIGIFNLFGSARSHTNVNNKIKRGETGEWSRDTYLNLVNEYQSCLWLNELLKAIWIVDGSRYSINSIDDSNSGRNSNNSNSGNIPGGLGAYLSETIEILIKDQLRSFEPSQSYGFLNPRLRRLLLGKTPPIIRGNS